MFEKIKSFLLRLKGDPRKTEPVILGTLVSVAAYWYSQLDDTETVVFEQIQNFLSAHIGSQEWLSIVSALITAVILWVRHKVTSPATLKNDLALKKEVEG